MVSSLAAECSASWRSAPASRRVSRGLPVQFPPGVGLQGFRSGNALDLRGVEPKDAGGAFRAGTLGHSAMEDQPNLDPEFLLRPKDVLEQTGITHQILYRYITLGLIEPALTTKTGLRLFHPNVVLLIRVIQSITRNGGYSLRDLKDIFFKDERVRKLTAK